MSIPTCRLCTEAISKKTIRIAQCTNCGLLLHKKCCKIESLPLTGEFVTCCEVSSNQAEQLCSPLSRQSASIFTASKRVASPPSPATAQPAKLQCASSESIVTMAEGAPAWFVAFHKEYRADINRLDQSLGSVVDRLSALETTAGHTANEVAALRADVNTISESFALLDTREILLTGLPESLTIADDVIFKHLVEAVRLPRLYNQLISSRPWHGTTDGTDRSQRDQSKKGIVFKLASGDARDELILAAPRLRDIDFKAILNTQQSSKLYV